ncbi:hypothetical protein GSI_01436 [Ganoderma sinense ZZ0214-1]|uniref:Uncharacterized protein n=1 Tax=Ganoderma sinense ZZ0214-1 TaxID=1077348 RepID=A0A2G8SVH8_9APHY|nr:hypothetical protein GSI_01436 [Ganoderma sinense ZZ0214-1]
MLPSRLSCLATLNLAHNWVPKETFVELMQETIEAEVKRLVQWEGAKAKALATGTEPISWRAQHRIAPGHG